MFTETQIDTSIALAEGQVIAFFSNSHDGYTLLREAQTASQGNREVYMEALKQTLLYMAQQRR